MTRQSLFSLICSDCCLRSTDCEAFTELVVETLTNLVGQYPRGLIETLVSSDTMDFICAGRDVVFLAGDDIGSGTCEQKRFRGTGPQHDFFIYPYANSILLVGHSPKYRHQCIMYYPTESRYQVICQLDAFHDADYYHSCLVLMLSLAPEGEVWMQR